MGRILIRSPGPHGWQQLLAKPELHWATGYSARTLAHAWEDAQGFPPEVAALLDPVLGNTELLLAIPEWKTPLPGGRRESQSDIFVLGRCARGLVACTIEGKVDEPFGPTVAQQMARSTPGRIERLSFLCGLLGIENCPPEVHYQLLHRAATALIEAERFCAPSAAMIVHSFSPDARWFEAFQRFCAILGAEARHGQAAVVSVPDGRELILCWANGDQRYRLL